MDPTQTLIMSEYSDFQNMNGQHVKEARNEIGLQSDSEKSDYDLHDGHDLLDSFSEDSDPNDVINNNEVNIFGEQFDKTTSSYDPFKTETMKIENKILE